LIAVATVPVFFKPFCEDFYPQLKLNEKMQHLPFFFVYALTFSRAYLWWGIRLIITEKSFWR